MDSYHAGLEGLIGLPSPNILVKMIWEHTESWSVIIFVESVNRSREQVNHIWFISDSYLNYIEGTHAFNSIAGTFLEARLLQENMRMLMVRLPRLSAKTASVMRGTMAAPFRR